MGKEEDWGGMGPEEKLPNSSSRPPPEAPCCGGVSLEEGTSTAVLGGVSEEKALKAPNLSPLPGCVAELWKLEKSPNSPSPALLAPESVIGPWEVVTGPEEVVTGRWEAVTGP